MAGIYRLFFLPHYDRAISLALLYRGSLDLWPRNYSRSPDPGSNLVHYRQEYWTNAIRETPLGQSRLTLNG